MVRNEQMEELNEALLAGVMEVTVRKPDLSEIKMQATLCPNFLPPKPVVEETENAPETPKKERKVNPYILAVYSVDRQGWRSIKFGENLVTWTAVA